MPILGSSASQSGKTSGSATIVSVTAGDGSVSVAFTEPAYKGKGSITYTATSSPGGFNATSASSPIVVTGLSNGTAYTFTIAALSASGVSTSSSASSSVTPNIPQAGYMLGGNSSAGARLSTISKLNFTTEVSSNIGATLSANMYYHVGLANSGTAGYVSGGGTTEDQINSIQKLTFGTEQRTTIAATLVQARLIYHSGHANSGTAGYWAGGYNPGDVAYYTTIQKLTFSNEAVSSVGSNLSSNRMQQNVAMANSGTAGYISSGSNGGYYSSYSKIDKLTFSNETISALSHTYSSEYRTNQFGFANSGTAGYFGGGVGQNYASDSASYSDIVKVPFSTDSVTTLAATLRKDSSDGFARSGTAGYIGGGRNDGGATSSINKLTFSSDTVSTLASTLGSSKSLLASFANSGTL
jgi:hypothetical protein